MGDDDPIGRMRAEMDQAKEGLKEVAGNLWAFYNSLTAEGFDTVQAITLTKVFLAESLRRAGDDDE